LLTSASWASKAASRLARNWFVSACSTRQGSATSACAAGSTRQIAVTSASAAGSRAEASAA
jgi:hypothetical protein